MTSYHDTFSTNIEYIAQLSHLIVLISICSNKVFAAGTIKTSCKYYATLLVYSDEVGDRSCKGIQCSNSVLV